MAQVMGGGPGRLSTSLLLLSPTNNPDSCLSPGRAQPFSGRRYHFRVHTQQGSTETLPWPRRGFRLGGFREGVIIVEMTGSTRTGTVIPYTVFVS